MRRLYLRIYLAVLASLVVFALVTGFLWHLLRDSATTPDRAAQLVENVLPPAGAPVAEQQAALERVGRGMDLDLALFSADGRPLAMVGMPQRPPRQEGWQHVRRGPPLWAVQLADGRWLSVRGSRERRGGPPWMGPFRGPLGLLFVLTLVLAAIGVGAYPVVRRLTKRLERLQAGVEALGAGRLSERVAVEGRDEVAALAESFNRAATRIESLVQANKSLLANASHELRTPLTRVRMALELGKDRREIERDIAELDALIDEILLASRLDAVEGLEHTEEVDLLALAAEECARYDGVDLAGDAATVRGDPRLLRRAIRNLLENALRHGRAPVVVRIGSGEIRVCDAGPGVPETERERVFEAFYRRAGSTAGAGLGLALVRQIARRHGGEATCTGNCFEVRLPTRA